MTESLKKLESVVSKLTKPSRELIDQTVLAFVEVLQEDSDDGIDTSVKAVVGCLTGLSAANLYPRMCLFDNIIRTYCRSATSRFGDSVVLHLSRLLPNAILTVTLVNDKKIILPSVTIKQCKALIKQWGGTLVSKDALDAINLSLAGVKKEVPNQETENRGSVEGKVPQQSSSSQAPAPEGSSQPSLSATLVSAREAAISLLMKHLEKLPPHRATHYSRVFSTRLASLRWDGPGTQIFLEAVLDDVKRELVLLGNHSTTGVKSEFAGEEDRKPRIAAIDSLLDSTGEVGKTEEEEEEVHQSQKLGTCPLAYSSPFECDTTFRLSAGVLQHFFEEGSKDYRHPKSSAGTGDSASKALAVGSVPFSFPASLSSGSGGAERTWFLTTTQWVQTKNYKKVAFVKLKDEGKKGLKRDRE